MFERFINKFEGFINKKDYLIILKKLKYYILSQKVSLMNENIGSKSNRKPFRCIKLFESKK
ncbi:hypothetical protein [Mycoplasmopsis felis]|uniref:hypothetical protein n=1 Tax=Mycoplasmopsis felis TaxID=33923 RepID=UPI002AFE2C0F|nr:hypothetical protein [Mycoplasmopsis felis]WQQ03021.1 hypothetical protein RRG38_02590 [Mycoplasmopsis felis]